MTGGARPVERVSREGAGDASAAEIRGHEGVVQVHGAVVALGVPELRELPAEVREEPVPGGVVLDDGVHRDKIASPLEGRPPPAARVPGPAYLRRIPAEPTLSDAMEFLNFLLILWAGWLVWRRPERERFAFRLLIVSCLVMALLFLVGTHGSLIPGVNL